LHKQDPLITRANETLYTLPLFNVLDRLLERPHERLRVSAG
jgi:hypothetical protein